MTSRDTLNTIPVVYTGGCCGDLVSSLIDWKDSNLNQFRKKVVLPENRQRLKYPASFNNDEEKDLYLSTIKNLYDSVPSHDIEYHIKRKHWFIGISIDDPSIALWAAERFKNFYHPDVWKKVEKLLGLESWQQYAEYMLARSKVIKKNTCNVLQFEDILTGKVVPKIESILQRELPSEIKNDLYPQWQSLVYDKSTL